MEATDLRLLRRRFTVRGLMVAVAIVGLLMGLGQIRRNNTLYQKRITSISRIKRSVERELYLNPDYPSIPCSRPSACIFASALPPRYNGDFPHTRVGEPPWTPPSNSPTN